MLHYYRPASYGQDGQPSRGRTRECREGRRYHDDRHDRSRSPRRERDRDRSRSPGPRKGDLLSRIGDKIWGPLEIEQPDQRDMFVGIKYHFHATTEFERRASTPIRLELNKRGAKPCRNILDAKVVLVFQQDRSLNMAIRPEPIERSIQEAHKAGFTLHEVYSFFANRQDRMSDPHRQSRKSVVQAEWVNACIQMGRRLEGGDKGGYEIKAVNEVPHKTKQQTVASVPLVPANDTSVALPTAAEPIEVGPSQLTRPDTLELPAEWLPLDVAGSPFTHAQTARSDCSPRFEGRYDSMDIDPPVQAAPLSPAVSLPDLTKLTNADSNSEHEALEFTTDHNAANRSEDQCHPDSSSCPLRKLDSWRPPMTPPSLDRGTQLDRADIDHRDLLSATPHDACPKAEDDDDKIVQGCTTKAQANDGRPAPSIVLGLSGMLTPPHTPSSTDENFESAGPTKHRGSHAPNSSGDAGEIADADYYMDVDPCYMDDDDHDYVEEDEGEDKEDEDDNSDEDDDVPLKDTYSMRRRPVHFAYVGNKQERDRLIASAIEDVSLDRKGRFFILLSELNVLRKKGFEGTTREFLDRLYEKHKLAWSWRTWEHDYYDRKWRPVFFRLVRGLQYKGAWRTRAL